MAEKPRSFSLGLSFHHVSAGASSDASDAVQFNSARTEYDARLTPKYDPRAYPAYPAQQHKPATSDHHSPH